MLLILHQACVCWAYCWCGISNMIAHQRKTWMFLMACFWNADFEAEEVKSLFFFLLVGYTALEGAAGEPLELQQHSQNDSLKLPYVWKIALEMIWDCDHWTFLSAFSLGCKAPTFPPSCRLTPEHCRRSLSLWEIWEEWWEKRIITDSDEPPLSSDRHIKLLLLLFAEVEFGIEVGSHEVFLFSSSRFFFLNHWMCLVAGQSTAVMVWYNKTTEPRVN